MQDNQNRYDQEEEPIESSGHSDSAVEVQSG